MTNGQAKRYQQKVDELLCLTDVFNLNNLYHGENLQNYVANKFLGKL